MSAYISIELQRQIRTRFADCCAYCRTSERLTVAIFEFDHIIPRSLGGQTQYDNLCLACPTCNRYKADRQAEPDPLTGDAITLFHPQRQVWTDHFAWTEAATEITGLTAVGRATIVALRMNRPQMIRVRRMWVAMNEHPPHLD